MYNMCIYIYIYIYIYISAEPRRATKEGQRVLRTPPPHIRTLAFLCSAWFYKPWLRSKTPFLLCHCLVGRCLYIYISIYIYIYIYIYTHTYIHLLISLSLSLSLSLYIYIYKGVGRGGEARGREGGAA